jgi:methylenetetrahydrofolate reductase (NADPH)
LIGAVTTNYKLLEGEVMPQYLKLQKKIECGAHFIINQVGFDSRKIHELRVYMNQRGMKQVPLIGNVYVLSPKVAQIFHEGRIPGIVVTPQLLALCLKQAQSQDGGREFFLEFAAKQMAVYRALGYRGVYLGGVYNFESLERVLEIERTFAPDDWREFAREIHFSRPGEFHYYAGDPETGLANPAVRNTTPARAKSKHLGPVYHLAKWSHDVMFTPGKGLSDWGAKVCRDAQDPSQGPKPLRALEHLSKALLFQCKDCGDCSLANIAFLCPESQCAKNQRNGPCGGTREGRCEVDGFGDCIWLRAYERLKYEGKETELLDHAPMVQNQGLRGTSAWANFWLGRDHAAKQQVKEVTKSSSLPIAESAEPAEREKELNSSLP